MTFSEILGRSFAGGLLELTPKEFKSTPLPYIEIDNEEFEQFKGSFKKKSDISEILVTNNMKILTNTFNCSQKDIKTIEEIRLKLLDKRHKKII